jgi:Zn finger protein HypA/HybF involved in hydrogenase expression
MIEFLYPTAVALAAYCPTCERMVDVGEDDTPVCPVCSTPLMETVEGDESETAS